MRGRVERLAPAESDEYFASRPRESMVGAWASPQSEALADRDELERRVAEVESRFGAGDRCPGRRTGAATGSIPDAIEFWQGQVGRLHDRFRYERAGSGAGAAAGAGPGSPPEEPAPRL